MILLSIIIPIYNVEKYLNNCIESLCKQNLKNTEIILVDDGSKDNSGAIADEFTKNYNYIRVFHKKNGGLSDARNYGVKKAKGKYLIFVDADDYVDDNFIKIYDYLADDTELFFMGYTAEYLNKSVKNEYIDFGFYTNKKDIIQNCLKICTNKNSVWSKIVKKSFFVDNNLWFKKGFAEDFNWLGRSIQYAEKAAIIPLRYYHYIVERSGSLMNTYKIARIKDVIEQAKNVVDEFEISNIDKILQESIRQFVGFNILSNYRMVRKLDKKERIECCKILDSNKYLIKKQDEFLLKIVSFICIAFGSKFIFYF